MLLSTLVGLTLGGVVSMVNGAIVCFCVWGNWPPGRTGASEVVVEGEFWGAGLNGFLSLAGVVLFVAALAPVLGGAIGLIHGGLARVPALSADPSS